LGEYRGFEEEEEEEEQSDDNDQRGHLIDIMPL